MCIGAEWTHVVVLNVVDGRLPHYKALAKADTEPLARGLNMATTSAVTKRGDVKGKSFRILDGTVFFRWSTLRFAD